jgi:hypothetical protein
LPGDQLFMLENGLLHGCINHRALFYLHEGDLIGLRQDMELPRCRLRSDNPLVLTPYLRSAVFQHPADPRRSELFLQYMAGQTALLSDAVARLKQPGFAALMVSSVSPVRSIDPARRRGDHVLVIIEGHAEAFVDGLKVGEVPKEEIFGAMAVFTGERRNASVVTSEPSTIMRIPGSVHEPGPEQSKNRQQPDQQHGDESTCLTSRSHS